MKYKITKTHAAIAILIILGAIFASHSLSTWPSGTTSDTVKCGGGWTNIGYGASAMATSCGSSYTVLNFRVPWGEELNGVKVYERSLKTFVNPNDDTEWLYVWAIGCSSSGTYFVVNYGPPDLCANVETPNTCIGYDLWSQTCVDGNVVKDAIIEEKSIECGYICTHGELQQEYCTDGTPLVTAFCVNNIWEEDKNYCPLNWINLEMILRGYIEDIKTYLEKLI